MYNFLRQNTPWLLVAGFVWVAGVYSVVNPLFEAPDEVWHYEYVRWLAEGHGLPQPDEFSTAPWRQEGSQPPLYYLMAAALTWFAPTTNAVDMIRYNPHAAVGKATQIDNKNMLVHNPLPDSPERWPWRGVALAAHLVRWFSIGLGAVTIISTIKTALTLFPGQTNIALGAALLVASNPQFLFLSAAINNDNLVTTCSALVIWRLVHLVALAEQATRPQWLLLGLLQGLAALSKVSGLALLAPIGVGVAWYGWCKGSWRAALWAALNSGGAALLVAGWWYGRNWWLYGEPLGITAMFAVLPGRSTILNLQEVLTLAQGIGRSYWAVFGWFNIVADPWLYTVYMGLTLLGALGLVAGLVQSRRQAPGWWVQMGLLGLWVLALLLSLVRWAQISYPQGRLLFPTISALATLLAWGLLRWWPPHWQLRLLLVLAGGLGLLAVLVPWRWIKPAYAAPPLLEQAAVLPNPSAIAFGDQVILRGYTWQPARVQPGELWTIDLYWERMQPLATDYSIFVHLIDHYEIIQSQRDSFPAGGQWATSNWPPSQVVPDRHQLKLPAVLRTPLRLRVDVGVYDHHTMQRLPVAGGDRWTLGMLEVSETRTPGEPTVFVNFADQLALVDYSWEPWLLRAGNELSVTLVWQALRPLTTDYTVFVHLLLLPDAVWAQSDAQPQSGASPTSTWRPGEKVVDRYTLRLPPQAPSGLYTVEIGVYDSATGDRLKVNLSDAGVRLGQLRVQAPS